MATPLRLTATISLFAVLVSACGPSATAIRGSTIAACHYAERLTPTAAPKFQPGIVEWTIAFAWPKSFIAGLEHSDDAILVKLGSELVTSDSENWVATNKAVARVKSVCEGLLSS